MPATLFRPTIASTEKENTFAHCRTQYGVQKLQYCYAMGVTCICRYGGIRTRREFGGSQRAHGVLSDFLLSVTICVIRLITAIIVYKRSGRKEGYCQ